jgi:hypothetical protein
MQCRQQLLAGGWCLAAWEIKLSAGGWCLAAQEIASPRLSAALFTLPVGGALTA